MSAASDLIERMERETGQRIDQTILAKGMKTLEAQADEMSRVVLFFDRQAWIAKALAEAPPDSWVFRLNQLLKECCAKDGNE